MKYPYLRVPGRRRYRIGSFLGYDRRVDAPAGSFQYKILDIKRLEE